jgi:hypothetical protein
LKNIHSSIKGIQKEVKEIKRTSTAMVGGYANERTEGAAEWNKMQEAIALLRKSGNVKPAKTAAAKSEKKKDITIEMPVEAAKEVEVKEEQKILEMPFPIPFEAAKETASENLAKVKGKSTVPMTLEEKILDYINKHPMGVKVSEMEAPLGETRMKIGYIAKALLEEGKVQKMDNLYFPSK